MPDHTRPIARVVTSSDDRTLHRAVRADLQRGMSVTRRGRAVSRLAAAYVAENASRRARVGTKALN
jgi:hypothetical protein